MFPPPFQKSSNKPCGLLRDSCARFDSRFLLCVLTGYVLGFDGYSYELFLRQAVDQVYRVLAVYGDLVFKEPAGLAGRLRLVRVAGSLGYCRRLLKGPVAVLCLLP